MHSKSTPKELYHGQLSLIVSTKYTRRATQYMHKLCSLANTWS